MEREKHKIKLNIKNEKFRLPTREKTIKIGTQRKVAMCNFQRQRT